MVAASWRGLIFWHDLKNPHPADLIEATFALPVRGSLIFIARLKTP
jgi:hypothetical protein